MTDEVHALRHSAAVSRMDHTHYVHIRGEQAYEALDRVVAADLHIRDGQMIQSLLLDDSGQVFADIYLGSDDEAFFLLAEGPSEADLDAYLGRHLGNQSDVEFRNRDTSHALVMINGPYSWELLSLLAGADVVGLPYLTFFHYDGGICFRAGKTGEYGYGVLVDRADLDELWTRALEMGTGLDVIEAGLDALDHCALENWHFNIRREGREPVTPIELQLQWRISSRKSHVGSPALQRRRQEGPRQRLTSLVASEPLTAGDTVHIEDRTVGHLVNAGYSEIRKEWVAQGLVDIAVAYPGIDVFRIGNTETSVAARSTTPPFLNNRSLFLSPQIHSYSTRHEFTFPPLPRG